VKPNEVLSEFAPPMVNTCNNTIERVLDASNLEQEIQENQEWRVE
jgi:hypothetical protein